MICKNCGNPLEDGQRLCTVCGAQNDEAPASSREPAPVLKPVKKRKSRVGLVVVLLILALLVGAAVSVFVFKYPASWYNWGRNFIAKNFSPADEYYRAVETANLSALTGALRESGDRLEDLERIAEPELPQYREAKAQLRVNFDALGREFNDLLQDELGLDLSWLHNVGLYRSVGMTEEGTGGMATLFLNEHDLLRAGYVLSADNSALYLKVPALSDKYAKIDLSEYEDMLGDVNLSAIEGQNYTLPDVAKFADLIDRYADIFVSRVTDVEKGTGELKAGNVTKEVSTLVVRADGETLRDIGVAILESLENDKDFEEFVRSGLKMNTLYSQGSKSDDEWLAEMKDSLAQARQELLDKTPEQLTHSLVMTLYLDDIGRILGRDIEVFDKGESVFLLRYSMITDGSDFGLCLEIREKAFEEGETEAALFECSGKKGDGGVNGTMSFSFKPNFEDALKKMFDLDFEIAKKNDETRMSLLLIPSEALQDLIVEEALSEDAPEATEKLFRNLRARLVVEVKGTTQNMDLALLNGSEEMLALALEEYEVQPFDVSIPADAVDIEDWADEIDYGKLMQLEQDLLNALTEAGMPLSFLYGLIA